MNRLANKIAIISGGATGLGGAASKLFAAEGAEGCGGGGGGGG